MFAIDLLSLSVVRTPSRSALVMVVALGCTKPVPEARPLPIAEVDAAPAPTASTSVDEELIGSPYWRPDKDPGCRWEGSCWHAPKQAPTAPGPKPFETCRAESNGMKLDEDTTRKGRMELAKDACCYLERLCKRPKQWCDTK